MKKTSAPNTDADLRPEYDFDYKTAAPNRFVGRMASLPVVVLDPDVAKVFTTPEEVNNALRALISAMPGKQYARRRDSSHAVSEK